MPCHHSPGQGGQQAAKLTQGAGHLHRFRAGAMLAQRTEHAIGAGANAIEAQARLRRMKLLLLAQFQCGRGSGYIIQLLLQLVQHVRRA